MTSIKRLAVLALVGFVGLVNLRAQAQSGPQPKLPTTPLTIGIHVVQAELAVTPEQQATGMMFRTRMGTHEGMLFVNDDVGVRCFWMRNTLVPLTIAFIADDGTIVNTADMGPRSEKSHCSAQPVRFALEMNLGWFAKRGIKPGAKIIGKPFRR
jgi:uncharacterized membrane protein (UPF0127 family)